jgi:DNA-binding CsgD family transcriptional regulator
MERMKLLSRREKEVISLLMQGKSNKQIAFALGVSERTIEFHLKNVYTKLQVTSRVELILALGKATGSFSEKLGQTTVDSFPNGDNNGKQPAKRWAQPLKNIIFTTQKEFAMFRTIVIENIEGFLRKHSLLLPSLLFVIVSSLVRYLIIDIGLYLWFSYLALGIFLLVGSLYFGVWWRITAYKKNELRLYKMLPLAVLLPACIALADVILRHAIARVYGEASITVAGISNKLMWLTLSNGHSYFYTERLIPSDNLWLYSSLGVLLTFLIGVFISRSKAQKDMASL